jgi:hypothetical protein
MIGSVSPAIKKYPLAPGWWVLRHKVARFFGGSYSMFEQRIVRDLRDGKVSKEELDACSTCVLNA